MLETPTEDDAALALEADAAGVDLGALTPEQLAELQQAARDEERAQAEYRQKVLSGLAQRILGEYAQRKAGRSEVELRWHNDIRRYNAVYDAKQLAAIKSRGYGSTAFIPLARRLCNIVEARLSDMLFPSEDRNYAITSTPVPELDEAEGLLAKAPPGAVLQGGITAADMGNAVKELRHKARLAAEAMQREVDDQLRESNYGAVGRAVIRDMIVLGMGVMKGPTLLPRTRKAWRIGPTGIPTLEVVADTAPSVVRVDPWNFFPDAAATDVRTCTPIEVHWLLPSDLRALAQVPGFDKDAIREVLRVRPGAVRDSNREQLREAAGTQGAPDLRYEIVEYHGPVEAEELMAAGVEVPDADDPLAQYDGIVWTSATGHVLKAIITPMATAAHPYSVVNWQPDPGSLFGFGLPHEVGDLLDVCNSTFRAAVDNNGLAMGAQIVVGRGVRPLNGQWVIEPNKLWEMTDDGADVRQAFGFFQIDSRTKDLMELFGMAKAMLDEIGGSQLAMMGQDAPSFMETARGASMAYNASNVWMRRAVRLWDDNATTPTVQRFVDWNMEHNPKAEIKGDLRVQARGTSALLEAESQAQRIASFVELAKDVPMSLRNRVAQLREMARGMRLDPVDMLPTDEEVARMEQAAANQPPPPNPEIERINLRKMDLEDREREREFTREIEASRRELRIAEIASRENLSLAQVREKYALDRERLVADLQDRQEQRAHDAAKFNAEIVTKQRMGTGI